MLSQQRMYETSLRSSPHRCITPSMRENWTRKKKLIFFSSTNSEQPPLEEKFDISVLLHTSKRHTGAQTIKFSSRAIKLFTPQSSRWYYIRRQEKILRDIPQEATILEKKGIEIQNSSFRVWLTKLLGTQFCGFNVKSSSPVTATILYSEILLSIPSVASAIQVPHLEQNDVRILLPNFR